MGMFDSFYFEDGILPDNKVEANHEFQTKSLDCDLDDYYIDSNGIVKKFIMSVEGRIEDTNPINITANVYSHVFLYDNENDIMNRKYLGCLYQEYKIVIVNSMVVNVEKLSERGYKESIFNKEMNEIVND